MSPTSAPFPPQTVENGAASLPHRDRGRFTAGNQEARKHGLHSKQLPPEIQALIESAESFAERSIADAGGAAKMTARERSMHAYRGIVHERIQQMHHALQTFGIFDGRGRLRVGWISTLESLIASARALDARLGLDRPQPKNVSTPAQWFAGQQENSNGSNNQG